MQHRPVLFLDFDRTLFDTERFYEWLGGDRYANILALMSGELSAPDFKDFLYDDTLDFLIKTREHFRIVVLTYSVNVMLQRRKVRGTGIAPLVDDVVITEKDKGVAAREYLARIGDPGWEHVFVDDAPENVNEMKATNPDFRVIHIKRKGGKIVTEATDDKQPQPTGADITVESLQELLPYLL